MSFKLFLYYCAVVGGLAAVIGWCLGHVLAPELSEDPEKKEFVARAAVLGLFLGATVALGVGLVDALWILSTKQTGKVLVRGGLVAGIGCAAGALGGALGEGLHQWTGVEVLNVLGWTLTGLLIGVAVAVYDVVLAVLRGGSKSGGLWKMLKAGLGGTLGGFLGGVLSVVFHLIFKTISRAAAGEGEPSLYSPSLWGMVALGVCIGLFISGAQVILREAWVKVESGFRAGREVILSKEETTIGRGEGCDIGLFGDAGVEKIHCRIVRQGGRYLVADADTPGGTFVNDQRLGQPTPLRSGDRIRVGKSVLSFREREKRQ